MHCSQRIIIKDIHRLTPTGGSLKYAIFDDRILFFAFALCSIHKLALKYFIVNPFFQVNKNSYFFQVFQRYMYACCIFFLVKTKPGMASSKKTPTEETAFKNACVCMDYFFLSPAARVRHSTSLAPASFSTRTHSDNVAPVVRISSMSSSRLPANRCGSTAS